MRSGGGHGLWRWGHRHRRHGAFWWLSGPAAATAYTCGAPRPEWSLGRAASTQPAVCRSLDQRECPNGGGRRPYQLSVKATSQAHVTFLDDSDPRLGGAASPHRQARVLPRRRPRSTGHPTVHRGDDHGAARSSECLRQRHDSGRAAAIARPCGYPRAFAV